MNESNTQDFNAAMLYTPQTQVAFTETPADTTDNSAALNATGTVIMVFAVLIIVLVLLGKK